MRYLAPSSLEWRPATRSGPNVCHSRNDNVRRLLGVECSSKSFRIAAISVSDASPRPLPRSRFLTNVYSCRKDERSRISIRSWFIDRIRPTASSEEKSRLRVRRSKTSSGASMKKAVVVIPLLRSASLIRGTRPSSVSTQITCIPARTAESKCAASNPYHVPRLRKGKMIPPLSRRCRNSSGEMGLEYSSSFNRFGRVVYFRSVSIRPPNAHSTSRSKVSFPLDDGPERIRKCTPDRALGMPLNALSNCASNSP